MKVELTPEDKAAIGRRSSPRWEIDVIGYKAKGNQLYVVECKSYLDSAGVRLAAFDGSHPGHASRYKLFNDPILREVVIGRIVAQLAGSELILPDPNVTLCLAAGKIHRPDKDQLRAFFEEKKWKLWDREWLKSELNELADSGYENSIEAMVAKLLLRT